MLTRLREETAEMHRSVERRLGLGSQGLAVPAYVDVLAAFYGFLRPWESAVRRFPWPDLQALFADRWRLPRLADDLRHFGVIDLGRLPTCEALPRLADPARVLGSCYVLEGSTLGGQVVSRHLEVTLGLAGGAGYSFFRGPGPAVTGARWKQFVGWLTARAAGADPAADRGDAGSTDAVVAGAVDTFASMDGWFATRLGRPVVGPAATPDGSAVFLGGFAR